MIVVKQKMMLGSVHYMGGIFSGAYALKVKPKWYKEN